MRARYKLGRPYDEMISSGIQTITDTNKYSITAKDMIPRKTRYDKKYTSFRQKDGKIDFFET